MNQEETFSIQTQELKTIIGQAENSGNAAWKAGEILNTIHSGRNYKIKYGNFQDYCKAEFGISDVTALDYIKIFKGFGEEEVGNLVKDSLKVILDIENHELRKNIVAAFSEETEGNQKVKDVIAIVALLKKENNVTLKEIRQIVKQTIIKANQDRDEKKKKQKDVKFGEPLLSVAFPELQSIIEKIPINEMGVVALFCVIFKELRNAPFQRNGEIYYFKTIKYVQTGFPDACVICRVQDRKNTNTELFVEFEYKSFEYIVHKHHQSERKCDMIICWEDNARSDIERAKSKVVQELPPILSLRDLLENGRITMV